VPKAAASTQVTMAPTTSIQRGGSSIHRGGAHVRTSWVLAFARPPRAKAAGISTLRREPACRRSPHGRGYEAGAFGRITRHAAYVQCLVQTAEVSCVEDLG
jgi:hypothetical protein